MFGKKRQTAGHSHGHLFDTRHFDLQIQNPRAIAAIRKIGLFAISTKARKHPRSARLLVCPPSRSMMQIRAAANASRSDHSGHFPKPPQNRVRSPGSSAATRAKIFDCTDSCSLMVSRQSERSCAIPALIPVRDTTQRIRQSAPEWISYSTSPRVASRSCHLHVISGGLCYPYYTVE